MPTYNAAAVSDAVIAHKKGITLQQGRAFRDNLLAVIEGDASAPRVQPAALEMFYGRASAGIASGGSTVVITVTDLDAVDYVLALGTHTATTSGGIDSQVEYQTSSNNGVSWSSATVILAQTGPVQAGFAEVINLTAANAVRIVNRITTETGTSNSTVVASILGIGGLVV